MTLTSSLFHPNIPRSVVSRFQFEQPHSMPPKTPLMTIESLPNEVPRSQIPHALTPRLTEAPAPPTDPPTLPIPATPSSDTRIPPFSRPDPPHPILSPRPCRLPLRWPHSASGMLPPFRQADRAAPLLHLPWYRRPRRPHSQRIPSRDRRLRRRLTPQDEIYVLALPPSPPSARTHFSTPRRHSRLPHPPWDSANGTASR